MFELIRKYSFQIACLVVVWAGWSAVQAASPTLAAPVEEIPAPPPLTAEDLPLRAAQEPPRRPGDPFFLQELLRRKVEKELARQAAIAEAERRERQAAQALTPPPSNLSVPSGNRRPARPEPQITWVQVSLRLQGTLPSTQPPQAWVNGGLYGVGEAIPHVDPANPPRLVKVEETRVEIAYGDEIYRLDLDHEPVVAIAVGLSPERVVEEDGEARE